MILNKFGVWQILNKIPSTKFHRNPSIGNRGDTCGQTDYQSDTISVEESDFMAI
jgi:hypothetical protein